MTTPALLLDNSSPPNPISLVEVFRERAEARATLYEACVYDLHTAVDVLQADAERSGLVAEIGQDEVQKILRIAFHAVRDVNHHTTLAINTPDKDRSHHLPISTIRAAEFLIKQNDSKRLREWLAKHTRAERLALKHHFMRR